MLRKIYEFIDDHARNSDGFQFTIFLICGILSFILFFFCIIDSTPATTYDYRPLIEQNTVISENFNAVYTYDNYNISDSGGNIEVVLSNDQCKLTCTYDKNFKFINYEEIDLAESKFEAILLSFIGGFIFLGAIGMYILGIFLPFLIYYLLKMLERLCLLLVRRR